MNKKLVYVIAFISSIASIIGLAVMYLPKDHPLPSQIQVQSGSNNMQAGRDIIVNHNGESTSADGVFLYEEKIEIYWNEWWAHPLRSRKLTQRDGQAELAITGEGKTVDFSGVLSINCENGHYFWKTAANFQATIAREEIASLVPNQVQHNAYKLFCRGRW